jgi:hypothetical protein
LKLVVASLNLTAGLIWVFIVLRNFDRLSFLGMHRLPGHGGFHLRGVGLLPAVAGMLFNVSAVLGFRSWMRRHDEAQPPITTLFGSKPPL